MTDFPQLARSLVCSRLIICFSLFSLSTEPSTEIIGAPDLYIESGSTINLTCVVHNSPEPPAFIFWNHNNAVSATWLLPFFISSSCSVVRMKNSPDEMKSEAAEHQRSWQTCNGTSLTDIIHFISFMMPLKASVENDFFLLLLARKLKFYDLHVHCSGPKRARERRGKSTEAKDSYMMDRKKW
jgi:hypothetical protein